MKTPCVLIISLLCSALLQAQYRTGPEKQSGSSLIIGNRQQLYNNMNSGKYSFSELNFEYYSVQDTAHNKYGDLRKDKVEFNEQYPWWVVALKVTGANIFTFAVDRYLLNYDYSRVGFNSWSHNLQTGWEWDTDRFGMNFIVHPYSGSAFFNAGRSSGYDFWGSAPFAVLGSLEWEYFGENTLPAYNDIINTTVDGVFLGEVTYRLGSNILDDQSTGIERIAREFSVFLLSPTRAVSRFTQGKMFRVTSEQVYQTEPLNVTLSTGARSVNEGSTFMSGPINYWVNVHLDYGNPFEIRTRAPFDYFKFRVDLTKVVGRKILDNITGYGLLFGKNVSHTGNLDVLLGGFQHFDYFDNTTFELGTIGFGPGVITKLQIGPSANIYTNFLVSAVPLAGNSTHFGPDTSQFRDYNYGGGAELRFESTLNLGSWVSFTFTGYYFWIHTYVGYGGDHLIGLVKPRMTVSLFNNLSIGIEHSAYYSDRYTHQFGQFHKLRTEQKIFLSLYLESFKQEKE